MSIFDIKKTISRRTLEESSENRRILGRLNLLRPIIQRMKYIFEYILRLKPASKEIYEDDNRSAPLAHIRIY